MVATRTHWRRRWLPPLLVVAGLLILAFGVSFGLSAATATQRFLGWLLAAAGACNTLAAVWLMWWVWSGRGGPPPRH